MANPEHVELVKQGAEAIRKWREQNPDTQLDLQEAHLTNADLRRADLWGVDLRQANMHGTYLIEANLGGAHLERANLCEASLREANLGGANLEGVRGAEHAYLLETVRLIDDDASYFEFCYRPWPEWWFDWERLRIAGRLPLFGISYTALILIPIVFYGLALYNDKIELVRAWAEQVIALPDHPWHRLAPLVLERLHPRPIPSLSLVLLVSTILLAAASTLYTWRCPSRIKEFSRDQWCDQLGRSLLHYWPLAWKERYVRLACAVCYALGGGGALWVLGTKVWHTAVFIVQHSTWPWPWR